MRAPYQIRLNEPRSFLPGIDVTVTGIHGNTVTYVARLSGSHVSRKSYVAAVRTSGARVIEVQYAPDRTQPDFVRYCYTYTYPVVSDLLDDDDRTGEMASAGYPQAEY